MPENGTEIATQVQRDVAGAAFNQKELRAREESTPITRLSDAERLQASPFAKELYIESLKMAGPHGESHIRRSKSGADLVVGGKKYAKEAGYENAEVVVETARETTNPNGEVIKEEIAYLIDTDKVVAIANISREDPEAKQSTDPLRVAGVPEVKKYEVDQEQLETLLVDLRGSTEIPDEE